MDSDLPQATVCVKNEVYVGISLPCVRVVPGICCGLFPSVSYQIMLVDEGITWNLERSYSECAAFYKAIKAKYKSVELGDFPGKKFSPSLSKTEIWQRKAEMEHCLQEVLKIGDIHKNDSVRRFFSFEYANVLKDRDARKEAVLQSKETVLAARENDIKAREEELKKEEFNLDAKKQDLYLEERNMVAKMADHAADERVKFERNICDREKKKFESFVEHLMFKIDPEIEVHSPSKLENSVEKLVSDNARHLGNISDLHHMLYKNEMMNEELKQENRVLSQELTEQTAVPSSYEMTPSGSVKSDRESTDEIPNEEKVETSDQKNAGTRLSKNAIQFQPLKGLTARGAHIGLPLHGLTSYTKSKHRRSLDAATGLIENPVLRRPSCFTGIEEPPALSRPLLPGMPPYVNRDIYPQSPYLVARERSNSAAPSTAAAGHRAKVNVKTMP